MSISRRVGRLEALNPAHRECRCPRADDTEPLPAGLVEVPPGSAADPPFTAAAVCPDCGGRYELVVVEVVVERAAGGADGAA